MKTEIFQTARRTNSNYWILQTRRTKRSSTWSIKIVEKNSQISSTYFQKRVKCPIWFQEDKMTLWVLGTWMNFNLNLLLWSLLIEIFWWFRFLISCLLKFLQLVVEQVHGLEWFMLQEFRCLLQLPVLFGWFGLKYLS